MSSHDPQGIQHFSKMNDKDKAYMIKLVAILVTAIFAGIITGSIYQENGGIALIGFGLWLGVSLISSWYVKMKYDLSSMSNTQIIRHGIALGFLSYIFIWSIIFQFFIPSPV